jgi:hypothetical protein
VERKQGGVASVGCDAINADLEEEGVKDTMMQTESGSVGGWRERGVDDMIDHVDRRGHGAYRDVALPWRFT